MSPPRTGWRSGRSGLCGARVGLHRQHRLGRGDCPGGLQRHLQRLKAFVLALTQSLAVELADKGVRIQAVLPGFARTEIFDRVGGSFDDLDQERVMDVADLSIRLLSASTAANWSPFRRFGHRASRCAEHGARRARRAFVAEETGRAASATRGLDEVGLEGVEVTAT